MFKLLPVLAVVTFLTFIHSMPVAAQDRHALVVGVDNYENLSPLLKARNDAMAIHGALQVADFETVLLLDPDYRTMIETLSTFVSRLEPGDEAVFFFAGHGVQIDGQNYLLMSDIPAVGPGSELVLTSQSLKVGVVLDELRSRGTSVILMILDACRNNPFPREGLRAIGGERGLAPTEAPEGSLVLFSAGDGQTALDRLSDDDLDPNSVFTRSLLKHLTQPGLPVHEMARLVRSQVRELAATVGHPQFPAVYDQFDGNLILVPASVETTLLRTDQYDPCDRALPYWELVSESGSKTVLEEFIAEYAECGLLTTLARDRLATIAAEDKPVVEQSVSEVQVEIPSVSDEINSTEVDDLCPALGSIGGGAGGPALFVTFINNTGGTVTLNWLNDKGVPERYDELAPGDEAAFFTYAGHRFFMLDHNGNCPGGVLEISEKTRIFSVE